MYTPIGRLGYQVTRDRYSVTTGFFTPAATPTDVLEIVPLGTRAVRLLHMRTIAFATTAGTVPIHLIIRSASDTGGTPVNPSPVAQHPRASGSLFVIVNRFTVNPGALGTAVGTVRDDRLHAPVGTTIAFPPVVWDFTKYPLLSLSSGNLREWCVNLAGATLPAGFQMAISFDYAISSINE